MTLILEVEYLAGVSFAAVDPATPAPDWPPQPDRVFSALVATWAARGQNDEEADALRWLEALPVPLILENGAEPRTLATVFVPPNDARTNRQKHARGVLPALRSRQARRFPATRPNDRIVRFIWADIQPTPATLSTLQRLAHDTSYIGHSSSLTRCVFAHEENVNDSANATLPVRRVYRGRLQELQRAYARFEKSVSAADRPQKGAFVEDREKDLAEQQSYFADRWLILEHVEGEESDGSESLNVREPDLRACALVGKAIRDTILSGYRRIGLENQIPDVVSGHTSAGAPSRDAHIAVIPLAYVGFRYADSHVLGYAVVPPRGSQLLADQDFRKALRAVAPMDENLGRRIITITTGTGTSADVAFSIRVSPTFEWTGASMNPVTYTKPACAFATVTPIVLDRHLKEQGEARQEEIRSQINIACRNIGLPEPEDVVADKHSAVEGVPSAYPSGKSPAWMRWRVPQALSSRQMTHAVIRFAEPIAGPVILGAGRFSGLGLCRPLGAEA